MKTLFALLMLVLIPSLALAQQGTTVRATNGTAYNFRIFGPATNENGAFVLFTGDATTPTDASNIAATVFIQMLSLYQPTNTFTVFAQHAPITTVLNSASNVIDNTLWDYGLVKVMHGAASASNCVDFWVWIPAAADVANTNIWMKISITRSGTSTIVHKFDWDATAIPNLSAASSFTASAAPFTVTNTFTSVGTGFRTEVYSLPLGQWVGLANCLSKGQLRRFRIAREGLDLGDVNTSASYYAVTIEYKDAP